MCVANLKKKFINSQLWAVLHLNLKGRKKEKYVFPFFFLSSVEFYTLKNSY